MLKETITYTDYNGTERTEDFYFNFTKAEVVELEMGVKGGLREMIDRIIASDDAPTLISIFKDLVLKAHGVKSIDGKRFEKSQEIRDAFAQSEAYSQLFMKLAFDAEAAARFFNGVIPTDLVDSANN